MGNNSSTNNVFGQKGHGAEASFGSRPKCVETFQVTRFACPFFFYFSDILFIPLHQQLTIYFVLFLRPSFPSFFCFNSQQRSKERTLSDTSIKRMDSNRGENDREDLLTRERAIDLSTHTSPVYLPFSYAHTEQDISCAGQLAGHCLLPLSTDWPTSGFATFRSIYLLTIII